MTTFAFECENVLPKIIGQLDYREGRARPHHRLYIIIAPRETLQIQYFRPQLAAPWRFRMLEAGSRRVN
jgi:hypothetical protein